MPAGCLDDDPGIRPLAHIFVESKAPWYEIADDLPRFDAYPASIDAPAVDRPAPEPASRPGWVRGSCLCGGVVYEAGGDLEAIVFCHCSRCRKARSSAHNANLLVNDFANFRWLRGEDLLESFKVPGAQRFAVSFCRVCGSTLPRAIPESPRLGVPAGTLDGDPGARPRLHIFCGSKAPWFEIADDLPRFEEYPPGVE